MIVMADAFKSYGVPARPGKSAGIVWATPHKAGTIRYDRYSTSGRRSRNRHRCGQFNKSRGRLMLPSPRIVKKLCRVTIAGVPLVACPPVIACVRWALAGQLPVAPRGASSTRARVLAHATRPLATYYRLLTTLPAARRRSQDFVSFPNRTRLLHLKRRNNHVPICNCP